MCVVDLLEMIDVEFEQRQAAMLALALGDAPFQFGDELAAIRQSGQVIGTAHPLKAIALLAQLFLEIEATVEVMMATHQGTDYVKQINRQTERHGPIMFRRPHQQGARQVDRHDRQLSLIHI